MLTTYIILNLIIKVVSLNPSKYYADPRIHILGNHGILGKLHANLSPIMTNFIDKNAYDGRNIREEIIDTFPKNSKVLDLCCGVGYSTAERNNVLGIDTSTPMIEKAKILFPKKNFKFGNAETFIPKFNVDITTCFFSFHEMPQFARKNIIQNAINYTKDKLIIVDISPYYSPTKHMLYTEPYLPEYLNNIQKDLKNFDEITIKDKRATMWTLKL